MDQKGYITRDEIDEKEYKNKYKFNNNFFSQTKEVFKRERYLNMNSFNNRNAISKIRLSSHNFAINTAKWHNFQVNTKIFKSCERKE